MIAALVALALLAPSGFVASPRLAPAASAVAGKPVHVWCATSKSAWSAAVSETGGGDANGLVYEIGATDEYLAPLPCSYLLAWLNGKNPANTYGVAGSMLILAHESEHLRGLTDESETDCAALHAMPTMIRRYFPPRKRATVQDLMNLARDYHGRQGSAYTRLC